MKYLTRGLETLSAVRLFSYAAMAMLVTLVGTFVLTERTSTAHKSRQVPIRVAEQSPAVPDGTSTPGRLRQVAADQSGARPPHSKELPHFR